MVYLFDGGPLALWDLRMQEVRGKMHRFSSWRKRLTRTRAVPPRIGLVTGFRQLSERVLFECLKGWFKGMTGRFKL